jgi:hypothetical protein
MPGRGQKVQEFAGADPGDEALPRGRFLDGADRDVFHLDPAGPLRVPGVQFDVEPVQHGQQPVVRIGGQHRQHVEIAALGREVAGDQRSVHVQADQLALQRRFPQVPQIGQNRVG